MLLKISKGKLTGLSWYKVKENENNQLVKEGGVVE